LYAKKLDTSLSSFQIYTVFRYDDHSFFLDSGMDHAKLGRYSFIGSNPFLIFKSKNGCIEIIRDKAIIKVHGDPFEVLKEHIELYRTENATDLPFIGGAVGYLGYDLCHHIENLPRTAEDDVNIPDCYLGFYDGIIVIDHVHNEKYIVALGINGKEAEEVAENIYARIKKAEKKGVEIEVARDNLPDRSTLKSNFTKEEYLKAIQKAKDYIRAGDVYQVNLTQRFQCKINHTPYSIYARLRSLNPAPFAAFLNFSDTQVLSSSPERFIQIKDRVVQTRPIKGTRPRGNSLEEDKMYRESLLNSEKDKAELLMIVDLERNDLGRVAKTGSVKVLELFHLEEYATVYHLVATITAELDDNYHEIDCLKYAFPGGSITGAPKIRSMEIIDELEPTQRNVYTGCIGYIGFDGTVDTNIAIRTIVIKGDTAYFQVGGGIVWDSDPEDEYQETLHKAKALIEALTLERGR